MFADQNVKQQDPNRMRDEDDDDFDADAKASGANEKSKSGGDAEGGELIPVLSVCVRVSPRKFLGNMYLLECVCES